MKKRIMMIIVAVMLVVFAMAFACGCSKDGALVPPDTDSPITDIVDPDDDPDNDAPDTDDGDSESGDTGEGDVADNDHTSRKVYIKVVNAVETSYTMRKTSADGASTEIYSLSIRLTVGDRITVCDDSGNEYNFRTAAEFNGTAAVAGEYVFELRIDGADNAVYVTVPQLPTPPDVPDTEVPKDTKTTVYYTNSEGWNSVYAYLWNYSTSATDSTWPGKRLTPVGTSGYGETQYSIEVDYSIYDRIIFNDGNGRQTKDLTVNGATSGYYGKDGVFTMGTDDYGKVEYFTLKDAKNLDYIRGASKKISVYTPSNYTPTEKYGVLYMFDSQNLYIAADGAQQSGDDYGSWAVDVAVTNLVKNGGDGVIIVAIDNTDGHRDSELTMSSDFGTLTDLADNNDFFNGQLDKLGDFIKETVMPWVNARYSVDTDRSKTGIAGSSSGGLAAYYLGLRDNDVYGYIGAFSPANGLFTAGDWTRFYASKNFGACKPKIYVYCGKNDGDLEDMLLPAVQRIKVLTSYGFASSDIVENYVDGAMHNESYWRIAFTEFLSKIAG